MGTEKATWVSRADVKPRAPRADEPSEGRPPERLAVMRSNLLSGSAMVVAGLVVLLGGIAFLINQDDRLYVNQRLADAATPPPPQWGRGEHAMPAGRGPKIGTLVHGIVMHQPDGSIVDLQAVCAEDQRPLLLMTGSLSSSSAVRRARSLQWMSRRYGDRIRLAVLYTREAGADPPAARASSNGAAAGTALLPAAPEAERQTAEDTATSSLDDRLRRAGEYRERTELPLPIYIDAMDDGACAFFGGGTNMAILIDSGGRILARQAWFHPRPMARWIRRNLEEVAGKAAAVATE